MAVVDISLDGTFQQRSRASGWSNCVAGDGNVYNGAAGGTRVDYIQNADGGGLFTQDRIHFRFDVGSNVPSDGTITAVSLFLYTDDNSQVVTDSKYLKSKIAKATSTTLDNTGTAATTWDAIDTSVLHGDYVTVSTTDDAENEFDFGSGDLFDYVVAQHAAGGKAAFWHVTQLDLDHASLAPTGANTNQFNWTTDSNPPKLTVTYTPAPAPPTTKMQIRGGQTKILGNLKVG